MKSLHIVHEEDIEAYFSGKADNEQITRIRLWMKTPEGIKYISESMDKDISDIKNGVSQIEPARKIPSMEMLRTINNRLNKKRRILTLGRIAAVLIPLMAINLVFVLKTYDRGEVTTSHISVPAGEQLKVMLADGTSVMLNSGSKLSYPSRFTRKERVVNLTGEAFFEVAKDKKRPFSVETPEVSINVLGTKFNVNTIDKADITTVYLKEGAVALEEKVSGKEKKYIMKPGDMAMVQKSTGMCYIDDTSQIKDPEGWMHKRYYFKDAPLADLLKHLERAYGIEFTVKDHRLYDYTYTMSFKNESIDDILTQIETITPVKCINVNNNITIQAR